MTGLSAARALLLCRLQLYGIRHRRLCARRRRLRLLRGVVVRQLRLLRAAQRSLRLVGRLREARCHVSRRFARGMRGRGAPAWRLLRGAASWRRALAYCRRRTRRPGCLPARRARRRCAPPRRWWLLSPPRRRQPLREERVSQGRAVVRAQRRAPAASASPSARADTSSASITAASASRSACGCVQRERVPTGKAANERAANTAPAPQPLIS